MYGTSDLAPVPIKTFVTYDNQIPVDAKMLTDDKIGGAYVNFIPQKEWNYSFVKEAKERELVNFDKFTEENKYKLRQHIGKLRWVSDQSRPDVSYEELELSMAASAPTVKDWKTANKVVKDLMDTDVWIKYSKLRND